MNWIHPLKSTELCAQLCFSNYETERRRTNRLFVAVPKLRQDHCNFASEGKHKKTRNRENRGTATEDGKV